MAETARIDKWLWAARVYKTRSLAANACKNGRVTIGGVNVKPSHVIKAGVVINVKKPPVTYSFRVLSCIEQRVGAKLLPTIYENVTDPKQYELLEMTRISGFVDRARGTGVDSWIGREGREGLPRKTNEPWKPSGIMPSLGLTTLMMI